MKKWTIGIVLFICAITLASGLGKKQNIPPTTVAFRELQMFDPWQGDTYINGSHVGYEENVVIKSGDNLFVSLDGLHKYISSSFVFQRGDSWFIRANHLTEIQFVRLNDVLYLPFSFLEEYIRLDEHYFARGIIHMHTYLPGNINWKGTAYTLTNESAIVSKSHHRSITDDGRRMWYIQNELWIEGDDGLMYHYAKPLYTVD